MTDGSRKPPIYASGPWLLGIGLTLIGFLTLLLVLGWLRTFEVLALSAGLAVLGLLFGLYRWAHPDQHWSYWASYSLFSLAVFFGVGFFLDFRLPHYLAWGAFLTGLPFLIIYVRRVWLLRQRRFWWTAIPAGGLITLSTTLIQLRLGWPDHLLPGILITVFMGGLAGMLFILWYPNRQESNFSWVLGPMLITGILAALGFLIMIDMAFLALPFLLLGVGAYFLLRFVVVEWVRPTSEVPSGPPGASPQIAAPQQPQLAAGATMALPETTLTDGGLTPPPDTITLTSSAFTTGEAMPVRYTCDGQNVSPSLNWQNIPPGTVSLALICDDPDAPRGIWVHWVIYNLPHTATGLPSAVPPGESTPSGGIQGRNDFKQLGYGGPCPPPGKSHHYYFKLYALDTLLPLPAGATKREVVQAMSGHVLATGNLVGLYRRG